MQQYNTYHQDQVAQTRDQIRYCYHKKQFVCERSTAPPVVNQDYETNSCSQDTERNVYRGDEHKRTLEWLFIEEFVYIFHSDLKNEMRILDKISNSQIYEGENRK